MFTKPLQLTEPSTVSASEVADEDGGLDSEELSRRCEITRSVNVDKHAGSGSFILQDLFTNTLYLVAHQLPTSQEVCRYQSLKAYFFKF
jgi:hypothetical protein